MCTNCNAFENENKLGYAKEHVSITAMKSPLSIGNE